MTFNCFCHISGHYSTPTKAPSALSFTSDAIVLAPESPIWLNKNYVADYRLDEEVFENDVNVTIDQDKDSNE